MEGASAVLDIDTGGGERLSELQSHWPKLVIATENYPPNVGLSAARLVPLDAHVVDVPSGDYELMPFAGGAFDLILNRYSAFNPPELAHTLKHNG